MDTDQENALKCYVSVANAEPVLKFYSELSRHVKVMPMVHLRATIVLKLLKLQRDNVNRTMPM